MRTLARVYLTAAFAVVAIDLPAIDRGAAQPASRKAVTEDSAPAQAAPSPRGEIAIETRQLGSVLGIDVRTNTELTVGRIVDLLANRGGQVEAAVIEFGGFLGMGTRKIAIEWSALRLETSGKQTVAILNMTRDQLRGAPEYKPEQPIVVRQRVEPSLPAAAAPTEQSGQSEQAAPEQAAEPPKRAPSPKRRRRNHARDQDW
jgi:PRC-barrel domain